MWVLPFKDPQQAEIGRLRAGLKLRVGQEVVVRLATPRPAAPVPPPAPEIVHEDDCLLAVNKPPGVSVYPTPRHRTGSLVEQVHAWQRRCGGGAPATLCHRLDRETSGLVLFAKDRAARAEIGRQFEERRVTKTYLALVTGDLEEGEGRIELPVGRDPASTVEIKMAALADGQGRPAATLWKVRRRLPGRCLVELRPDTGRQHQLRVHLAAIGHPIVGDKLYLGGDGVFLRSLEGELEADEIAALGLGRQALHCWRLSLDHPADGARVTLEAPLWPDVAALAGPTFSPGD